MSVSFAILTKGRCFFGPLAKGLCSRHSLNLLQRNKLILRGATVGGLLFPKVLKNIINHFFSISYYRKLRIQEISLFLMTKDTQDEDRSKEDKSKRRSYHQTGKLWLATKQRNVDNGRSRKRLLSPL
jgi:hypothetical protein